MGARNEDEPAMGVTGIDDAIGDGFCVGDMRGSADGVWIGSDEAVGAMEVDGSDGTSPSGQSVQRSTPELSVAGLRRRWSTSAGKDVADIGAVHVCDKK